MKLKKKLMECNIIPIKDGCVSGIYENQEYSIPYEQYSRVYKENEISRYYFFSEESFDKLNPIQNIDFFNELQYSLLSKAFFNSNNILKYNYYIIFVMSNNFENDARYYNSTKYIEENLSFARKVFLKYNDINNYFNYMDIILCSKVENYNDKKEIDVLKKCLDVLDCYGIKSCLITDCNKENKEFIIKSAFKSKLNFSTNFDEYMEKGNLSCDEYFEKYFKFTNTKHNDDFELNHIKSIKNDSFRKNVLKKNNIELKKFNLIYGSNASGKTSFLESIEYTLTGSIHKSDINASDSKISIIGTNENIFTPTNSNENSDYIKNAWYKGKIGTLNSLFCKINYFDIEAAHRFANEYGNEQYKMFFCNYELLEARNNLDKYLITIDDFKDNLIQMYKMYDSYREFKNKYLKVNNFISDDDFANLDLYHDALSDCILKIDLLIEKEIANNMELINLIYQRLDSYKYNVEYNNSSKCFIIKNVITNECIETDKLSTAQKVCLALSMIFAQFFSAHNAPKFILFDESVANFDTLHLLNLYDFLRELVIRDIQIVFTTANRNIEKSAKNKFAFLQEGFNIIDVSNEN